MKEIFSQQLCKCFLDDREAWAALILIISILGIMESSTLTLSILAQIGGGGGGISSLLSLNFAQLYANKTRFAQAYNLVRRLQDQIFRNFQQKVTSN